MARRSSDTARAQAKKARAQATASYVRSLRDSLKLTQDQLAERLGVERSLVARWETRVMQPRGANMLKLRSLERSLVAEGQSPAVASSGNHGGPEMDYGKALLESFNILPVKRRIQILAEIQEEAESYTSQSTAAPEKG